MVDYDYSDIKTRQNKDHKVAHIVSKFKRFKKNCKKYDLVNTPVRTIVESLRWLNALLKYEK